MTDQRLVHVTRLGAVVQIGLANPPLNLVTKEFLEHLDESLQEIERDRSVRCVVLHQGAARVFCAGSDMREFESVCKNAIDKKILFEEYVTRRLAHIHCPTIAALDGAALGGGFELALACDIRIAAHDAKVGLTECHIGGLGGSGAVRLTQLVGPARASELLFTGKTLSATLAQAWGLINEVTVDESAKQRALAMASEIAQRGPLSNVFAKQLIAAAVDGPTSKALSLANELQEKIFQSEDLQRGAKAFFDKTQVQFEGR
jgi:enoyl-CoA hydratase/carnithine racemase